MADQKKIFKMLILSIVIFSMLNIVSVATAQHWNNSRDYEPITMNGEEFTQFLGQSIYDIFAYRYNVGENSWTQIPLQVDEKDDSTHFWFDNKNNVLNNKDVVIFMAKDLGDQAPSVDNWIDNPESRLAERYEIVVSDPNNSGSQGYVYFYLSSTIVDVTTGYMRYVAAPVNTGSDSVCGVTYVEGHTEVGIPNCWKIPITAGGNGIDILDRQKARLSGRPYGINIDITETDLLFTDLKVSAGKNRVARKITFTTWILGIIPVEFDVIAYYYPYSIDSRGATSTLSSSYSINHVRQSFDLKSSASGMHFHSNKNPDILIDGIVDAINDTLVFLPDVNWFLVTGEPGSILYLTGLSPLGNTRLYYHDESTGGTADGKVDTGDMQSWGDLGILITGTALEGQFSIAFKSYFLPKNQLTAIGPEFVLNFQNPLNVFKNSQIVPVELASFDAVVEKDAVKLIWATATESNNYGFEVQRKTAVNENWQKLGFVPGNGTSGMVNSYQYIDAQLSQKHYYYRLKQIDLDGKFEFSPILEVTLDMPSVFQLRQNYPNPFNPETVITYQVPDLAGEAINVELTIYNLLGDEVITLVKKSQGSGVYSARWNGRNNVGQQVSVGTYIYQLKAGNFVQTHKMLLLK